MSNCIVFLIPNSKNEGAQNFFRKLFHEINHQNKFLIIEENLNFFKNIQLIYRISHSSKLTLVTTVNSNKFGLIYKCLFPKTKLIARLGNTISQEIRPFSAKYFIHKFFYNCLVYLSSTFIFQSNYMKKDFLNFFKFRNRDNLLVIHNGTNILSEPHSSKNDHMSKDVINFLLVGSFKPQKGYDIFLDSLVMLDHQIHSKCHFFICGDGEGLDSFQQKIKELDLQKNITFYGNVWPDPYYEKADIYILPSKFEGFSNSLIEALSFGLPSIVSDCPGANKEVIIENFNGVFFKNLDSKDLGKKIIYMFHNFKSFSSIKIRQDINSRFSITQIASEYQKII